MKHENTQQKNSYEKYLDSFLEGVKEKETYTSIVKKMEEFQTPLLKWNNGDFNDFIKSLGSISENAVHKYIQLCRNFYEYVCEQEEITPKRFFLVRSTRSYIDLDKLTEVTLTENEYNTLRKELIPEVAEGDFNYRDKVMVELAWEGLTVDEIKHLKKDDIIINGNIVELKLKDRIVKIINQELAEDLIKAIKHDEYYIDETPKRKYQIRRLRDTDYLIRPIITRSGKNNTVNNPSQLLKCVFYRLDGILSGINLCNLTLEDIKRSGIINMFIKGYSIEEIQDRLGKKSDCDLFWLSDFAEKLKQGNLLKGNLKKVK